MINLKKECADIGMTVTEFCDEIDTPYNTVLGWSKTRQDLLRVVFDGIRAQMLVQQLKGFREFKESKND